MICYPILIFHLSFHLKILLVQFFKQTVALQTHLSYLFNLTIKLSSVLDDKKSMDNMV